MEHSFVHVITIDASPVVLWYVADSESTFNVRPLNIPELLPFRMKAVDFNSWEIVDEVPYLIKKNERRFSEAITTYK